MGVISWNDHVPFIIFQNLFSFAGWDFICVNSSETYRYLGD